jgi:hypothetical protein
MHSTIFKKNLLENGIESPTPSKTDLEKLFYFALFLSNLNIFKVRLNEIQNIKSKATIWVSATYYK